jgi:thymidylate synthase ThyX
MESLDMLVTYVCNTVGNVTLVEELNRRWILSSTLSLSFQKQVERHRVASYSEARQLAHSSQSHDPVRAPVLV